jgi:hypothetical protein
MQFRTAGIECQQGRQGHADIADPVGQTNDQVHRTTGPAIKVMPA